MAGSRSERRASARARSRRGLLVVSAVMVAVAVLVVAAAFRPRVPSTPAREVSSAASELVTATESGAVTIAEAEPESQPAPAVRLPVEMPDVRGRPLSEAQTLLTAAGFPVLLQGETSSRGDREAVVVEQSPQAGAKVAKGENVTLTLATADSPRARHRIVVLDPGHQARADLRPEPIGPDARETKERGTVGSVGVSSRRTESQVALEIAQRVRQRLEKEGIEVVMTRTRNDVALSNAERALVGNRAGADLVVRVHADGVADARTRGVSVLYPAGNRWVAGIAGPSRRAADVVRRTMVRTTGAPDRGIAGRADLAGFNWSRVPAILVEAGCLSNADEDRLLAAASYQDKVAAGIAEGVLAYFGR